MTKLKVKPGRAYHYRGKEYKAGETVEIADERYVKLLTMPKGPLEAANARKTADLPKAAYETRNMQAAKSPLASAPETSPATQEQTTSETAQTETSTRRRSGRYSRTDMRPEE